MIEGTSFLDFLLLHKVAAQLFWAAFNLAFEKVWLSEHRMGLYFYTQLLANDETDHITEQSHTQAYLVISLKHRRKFSPFKKHRCDFVIVLYRLNRVRSMSSPNLRPIVKNYFLREKTD